MMPAMYSAISGLEAHETMLNVTANNLANVDTIAYKAESTQFVSELAELMSGGSGPTAANGGSNPEQVGLGVSVGSVENEMGGGALAATGNTLDIAINGDGFLVVGSGGTGIATTANAGSPSTYNLTGGELAYTRAGNLTTDSNGYLTTQSGQYVLGYATGGDEVGAPTQLICIPSTATNVSIGEDGAVTYTDENAADTTTYGTTVTAGYVALASFPNESGLERETSSDWTTSLNSGAPTYGTAEAGGMTATQVLSGDLEQSNVDMGTEFANMIEAERGYQANTSVMSTVDTMVQTLIQAAQQ
jgi:flagellar hook protein FlgE